MATVQQPGFDTSSLTTLHWSGVVLAVLTGLIHLVLGLQFLSGPLGIPFVLAGVGFLGGVVLFFLDYHRRLLYAIGVPFTLIQFVLYFVFNWPDVLSPLGLADKAIQLALMVVLVALYQRES
ncbi:MAG: DUF7475 family protein [Halobacteriota archaeon]